MARLRFVWRMRVPHGVARYYCSSIQRMDYNTLFTFSPCLLARQPIIFLETDFSSLPFLRSRPYFELLLPSYSRAFCKSPCAFEPLCRSEKTLPSLLVGTLCWKHLFNDVLPSVHRCSGYVVEQGRYQSLRIKSLPADLT